MPKKDTKLVTKKRKYVKDVSPPVKRTRLISTLGNDKDSRSTKLWFDQEIFKDVDLDNIEDDEEEEVFEDSEASSHDANDSAADMVRSLFNVPIHRPVTDVCLARR